MTWKRRITDKIPKFTRHDIMVLLILIVVGTVLFFRTCSIKYEPDKGFSIHSGSTVKVKK